MSYRNNDEGYSGGRSKYNDNNDDRRRNEYNGGGRDQRDGGHGRQGDRGRQDDGYGRRDDRGRQDDGYGRRDDGYGRRDDGYGRRDDGYGRRDDHGRQDGCGSQNTRYDDRRGGRQDRDDGISGRMSQMRVSSRGSGSGGGGGMYSQHQNGGSQGRGYNASSSSGRGSYRSGGNSSVAVNVGSFSRGNGIAPVNKSDLPYNKIVFAKRPDTMIQDKGLGTKLDVLTNHTLVMTSEKLYLHLYNIEVFKNNKVLNKREDASPLFWEMFLKLYKETGLTQYDVVFNDVNLLWTVKKIPGDGEGRLTPKSFTRGPHPFIVYKYATTIEFGADVHADQEDSLMATVLDAIATSRVRFPTNKMYTVFKRNIFLVKTDTQDAITDNTDSIVFGKTIKWGLDARIGFSFAVKTNLRAGMTTCFDIQHTLFSKPCYPLVRLLVEVTERDVISDEEYEETWDTRLGTVRPDFANIERMKTILNKMSLTFCMDPAYGLEYAKKKSAEPAPPPGRRDRDMKAPRDFKFYDLVGAADEEKFFYKRDPSDEGVMMTVAQYFLAAHDITLRYPNLPCVLKKPKKNSVMKVMYPMEMCSYIVNPTRYEGFSPEGLRSQLIRDTSYTPNQRKMLLQHVMSQLPMGGAPPVLDNSDRYMKSHNVEIGKEMLRSKATLLPAPTVVYGNGSFKDSENCGEWEAIRNEPVRTILNGGDKERNGNRRKCVVGSVIIVHHPVNPKGPSIEFDRTNYINLMNALVSTGQEIFWKDVEARVPEMLDIHHHYNYTNPNELRDYIHSVKNHVDNDPRFQSEDFVVVPLFMLLFDKRCSFFPQKNNDYNMLKHFCDNVIGVYTQGMLLDNYHQLSPQPMTCRFTCHIVEKILGKIGTTHRKLERSKEHRPWFTLTNPDSPTLVLGIDVSHPSPADRKNPKVAGADLSIASIVGNIDTDVKQFRASARIQESGEEQIVRMEDQVGARFAEFIKNTGKRPDHVVVYRDGLCEGDFKRIMYEELNSIQNACEQISHDFKPTVTYILVSKRHHTKFFPVDPDDSYEQHNFNVKPGTLVEDVVTSTKYYDFFLATQVGQMGTSKPTHYYVLHDDWAPMISFWPAVTHALTYDFCRTTSTIALPTPVMYAHLAAKRAKEAFSASNFVDFILHKSIDMRSTEGHNQKAKEIQMHEDLDGMVFV